MTDDFRRFLGEHPGYALLHDKLLRSRRADRAGRLLASSAELVFRAYGETLGPVADEICAILESDYPSDYVERYLDRVAALNVLQRKFDQEPCARNLGDRTAKVETEDYNLGLLLSIVLTPHRFAIMEHLEWFLRAQATRLAHGRLAAIGIGSGYEVLRAARILTRWDIEGYDLDEAARARALRLLASQRIGSGVHLGTHFPLEHPEPMLMGRYDAIVMCELCEHLPEPQKALLNVGGYLRADAQAFVTMAINIAQEDHVFLYSTVDECRAQLEESALRVANEWLAPQHLFGQSQDRWRGNYIAIVSRGGN